jgi:hypothetical protein
MHNFQVLKVCLFSSSYYLTVNVLYGHFLLKYRFKFNVLLPSEDDPKILVKNCHNSILESFHIINWR